MPLDNSQRRELLALARQSIEQGLQLGKLSPCEQATTASRELRSSFITLRTDGELRGCCGSIEAHRPLAEDVWCNAWASAFRDPRFPPLTASEYRQLDVHISVLSPLEPLLVADEAALLQELRVGTDGLLLQHGATRATFLPAVWEQLGDPAEFVRHLKFKAGWRADFWSPQLCVFRYTTESFGE